MNMKKIHIILLFWICQTPYWIGSALASGGEQGDHGGGMLGVDPKVIIVQAIGFAIVFWVLKKYLFGPLTKVIEERREHIRTQLEDVESGKEEMRARKTEYDRRLGEIETEGQRIMNERIKEAQVGIAKLQADADRKNEEAKRKAFMDIEQEREKVLLTLRQEVAELALDMSSRLIRKELDKNKHQELIAEFINELDNNLDTAKL